MARIHPGLRTEDLSKISWMAPEGVTHYKICMRKKLQKRMGRRIFFLEIDVPKDQKMSLDIAEQLEKSPEKEDLTAGTYVLTLMMYSRASWEEDVFIELTEELVSKVKKKITKPAAVESAPSIIKTKTKKGTGKIMKAKKSAAKKTKPKLPTPGLKIIREDDRVALKVHLPSDTCKGVIIEVREYISGSTLCPAAMNRHEVKQKSRDVVIYLESLAFEHTDIIPGKYSVSVIAFNGETEAESDPAIESFDLKDGDLSGMVKAPKELNGLREPLNAALKGKKVEKVGKEATPLPAQSPAQSTIPPMPDVRSSGLRISVKTDPTKTKFVEVVGKTEDGREVIPLHQYPVGDRGFFLRGHLKHLLQGQTLEVKPDEKIQLQITAIGPNGERSATKTILGQLTQEEIERLNMPVPESDKPATDKVVPAPVKNEEKPPGKPNPPKLLPESPGKPTDKSTPAPAPTNKPSVTEDILAKIRLLASQESVDNVGKAVLTGTKLLSDKADKANADVAQVHASLKSGFGAVDAGLDAVKNQIQDSSEAVKTEVREGFAKIATAQPGTPQTSTNHSSAGMVTLIFGFLAFVLGVVVFVGYLVYKTPATPAPIQVHPVAPVAPMPPPAAATVDHSSTAELIAQQLEINRLQQELEKQKWGAQRQPPSQPAPKENEVEAEASLTPPRSGVDRQHIHEEKTVEVKEEVVYEQQPPSTSYYPTYADTGRRSFLGGLIQVQVGSGGNRYGTYGYHDQGRYYPTTGYVAGTGGYSVDPWALNHTWAQRVGEVKVHQGYSYVVPNLRVERRHGRH